MPYLLPALLPCLWQPLLCGLLLAMLADVATAASTPGVAVSAVAGSAASSSCSFFTTSCKQTSSTQAMACHKLVHVPCNLPGRRRMNAWHQNKSKASRLLPACRMNST